MADPSRGGAPNGWQGMRIIESVYLEQDGEPQIVRRTWRERLFSRPWRPFMATRIVVPKVPYRGAVRLDAGTLAMHPQTLRELKQAQWQELEGARHRENRKNGFPDV